MRVNQFKNIDVVGDEEVNGKSCGEEMEKGKE